MTGPFTLGGGLRREHWGAQQPTSAEGGGEAAPALPSCSRQAFAKASRGGEPCLVPAPQNQRLLPGAGRYTDKWIPTFTSFLVLLCFLEANWPLTLPSWYWPQGVATAQGRVVCLRRSQQGVGRAKGHIGSWASDSRLAWVVHVWPAPGLPLPHPSPRRRLCPQRWSHGYPRRFDPEPAIKCVYLKCLGLVGSLARTCPSPTVSLCLSLSLVVGDCCA